MAIFMTAIPGADHAARTESRTLSTSPLSSLLSAASERTEASTCAVAAPVNVLGVQSRSEVGWIVSEAVWVVSPGFADPFVGCDAAEGL